MCSSDLKDMATNAKYNLENAEELAKEGVLKMTSQLFYHMNHSAGVEGPEGHLSCMLEHLILPGIFYLEPQIRTMMVNAVSLLFDFWEDLKAEVLQPWLETKMQEAAHAIMDKDSFDKLTKALTWSAHKVCNVQTKILVMENARPGLVSLAFCANKTVWKLTESYRNTGNLSTIVEEVLPLTIENVFNRIYPLVATPTINWLTAQMMAATNHIEQLVIAGCSTLPVVGGSACAPWTATLSTSFGALIPTLVEKSVNSIWGLTKGFTKNMVTEKVVQQLDKFQAGNGFQRVTQVSGIFNASKPIAKYLVPKIANQVMKLFPEAYETITNCEDSLDDIYRVIKNSACPKLIQFSPPSPPPAPPALPPDVSPRSPPLPPTPPPDVEGCDKSAKEDLDQTLPHDDDDTSLTDTVVKIFGSGDLNLASATFEHCREGSASTPRQQFQGTGSSTMLIGSTQFSADFEAYLDHQGSGYFTFEGTIQNNFLQVIGFGGDSLGGGIAINFTAVKYPSGYKTGTSAVLLAGGGTPVDYVSLYFAFKFGAISFGDILANLFPDTSFSIEDFFPTLNNTRLVVAHGATVYSY